jgi:hypothetical protein
MNTKKPAHYSGFLRLSVSTWMWTIFSYKLCTVVRRWSTLPTPLRSRKPTKFGDCFLSLRKFLNEEKASATDSKARKSGKVYSHRSSLLFEVDFCKDPLGASICLSSFLFSIYMILLVLRIESIITFQKMSIINEHPRSYYYLRAGSIHGY